MLQQSIPFGVSVLYTLVQKHLTFVALKAKKTSSLHTIFILEKPKQTKQLVVLISNQVYFPLSLGLDTLFFLQSIFTLIV